MSQVIDIQPMDQELELLTMEQDFDLDIRVIDEPSVETQAALRTVSGITSGSHFCHSRFC